MTASQQQTLEPTQQEHSLPKPPISLADLVALLPQATLIGEGSVMVQDMAHPQFIMGPDQLVLVLEENALQGIQHSPFPVKAAIVGDEVTVPEGLLKGYIQVKRPRLALAVLLAIFEKPVHACAGIHPSAVVDPTATIHPTASIGALSWVGPGAVIGENTIVMPQVTVGANARLGSRCLLHPGVRIGERIIVGNRVIIHHNASIGADGFSYVTPEPGSVESARASGGKVEAKNTQIFKINSIGTVVIEEDVEIGACCAIDRANLGATLVKKGTKLDNLVMIAHNNVIGENCLIAAQTGIAGSCQIGNRVVMAGQVGIADHLKVGDDSILMAQAGLMRDVENRSTLMGLPAIPQREFFKNIMYVNKLKVLFQDIKQLKKRLDALEEK